MNEITTTDLSKFGFRELELLELLLAAMRKNGLPDDFENNGVTPMFNMKSGEVFLTNSEYQVAMEADGKLESWYSCPICGHEGFLEDMDHDDEGSECKEYYQDLVKSLQA